MSELDYMLEYVQLCQEGIDSQCFKSAWLAVITPAVYGGNDIHYNRPGTVFIPCVNVFQILCLSDVKVRLHLSRFVKWWGCLTKLQPFIQKCLSSTGNTLEQPWMATQELLFQCRNGHASVYVPGVGRENLKVREGIRSLSIHGALFVKKNKNINTCQAERSHNMWMWGRRGKFQEALAM